MHKRLPYFITHSLSGGALHCLGSGPGAGQRSGRRAVELRPNTQSPLVTVKIVNNSHKDITAFNIAIKETYADGHIDQHETMEEFLGKIIAAKENQGNTSPEAEYFHKLYGDGTLHPEFGMGN